MHMSRMIIGLFSSLVLLAAVPPADAQSGGRFHLKRSTIGGAAGAVSGDNIEVRVTSGEATPGTASGGQFSVTGGAVKLATCPIVDPPQPDTLALPGAPESLKNRMLSILPGNPGSQIAIRVTFDDLPSPFHIWNGAALWVGPSSEVSEAGASVEPIAGFPNFNAATLQCTPFYTDYSALGLVHVFHEGIVPLGSYTIEVIDQVCDTGVASNFSTALPLDTAKWGDTLTDLSTDPPGPPEGLNNIVDALGVIGRFGSQPGSIIKARADLEGPDGCLDLTINITDVLAAITGFQGLDYPFEPTADDPCNSICISPLP